MHVVEHEALTISRQQATEFESQLEPTQRKSLGQFFTGLPLARLLAALSVHKGHVTVIDPMAGHGDLLDAVFEHCLNQGIPVGQVDAIEIEPQTASACYDRLKPWASIFPNCNLTVHRSSAFNRAVLQTLLPEGYDLAITNPPYVRYQTIARQDEIADNTTAADIRQTLLQFVEDRLPPAEHSVWRELIRGYSGLSDLSVPCWLLTAMLVKPGGTLALVAPATWRTRDYADVLRYMLARCFELQAVVADQQPGWFSEALVRTHLVIARRLPAQEVVMPLRHRSVGQTKVSWVEIAPSAKSGESLVGAAFPGEESEGRFAEWLWSQPEESDAKTAYGITFVERPTRDETETILGYSLSSLWMKRLEPDPARGPLFDELHTANDWLVPTPLRHYLPQLEGLNLTELQNSGIHIGQGLRTGCNEFFYVEFLEWVSESEARVRVSDVLGGDEMVIPRVVLRPVLRRQSEVKGVMAGTPPPSWVLDLQDFVLPEDFPQVEAAVGLYNSDSISMPSIMSTELAAYVRRAANTTYERSPHGKRIPELSAVATNVRSAGTGNRRQPPRFWYMLPNFARRHLPNAFVPRINQDTPRVAANQDPPILIDANFSTLWVDGAPWSSHAICGLLNSSWARACMEAVGTPMGGGALKLEATHLRRLPIPRLPEDQIRKMDELGRLFPAKSVESSSVLNEIDQIVLSAILQQSISPCDISELAHNLCDITKQLRQARQR